MVHGLVCISDPADNTRQPWGAALSFTGWVTAVAAGLTRLATFLRHKQHVMGGGVGLVLREGLVGSGGLNEFLGELNACMLQHVCGLHQVLYVDCWAAEVAQKPSGPWADWRGATCSQT